MKYLFSFLFICVFSFTALAQEKYRSHQVEKGETVFSIAKKYTTTTEEIYRLNPNARHGVNTSTVLIIPSTDIINVDAFNVKFKKHRVRRKETLFSIAQRYDVSVDDIKRYNKRLYSQSLKKGDRIQIPIGLKKTAIITSTTPTETNTGNIKHTVQPKETKYGIARKYGITMDELEQLNPTITLGLQIGMLLTVPDASVTQTAVIEDDAYDFYEVKPKEGFFRLKVKLGISKEELIALNPYAKDGLREGMILKIPKENATTFSENSTSVNLEDNITNTAKKNIVVMLPFLLNREVNDSTNTKTELLKKERTLRVALDFYSGVLMATEFAKDKGISVNLDVYDTEASDRKVSSLISQHDFTNVDAVIGPLLQKNVDKVASQLRETNTPVFSPLSNREMKLYANFFQTLPTDAMLEKTMLAYLKTHQEGKNMVLISDAKRRSQKDKIVTEIDGIKTLSPRAKGFLYEADIASKIVRGMDNWVILESQDPVIVSNVVGLLNGMPPEYKLRLFTLDKNNAYDYHDISNLHLAKLHFTFPSVNKSYDHNNTNPFLVSYKNKYGVLPNRYAVRGFDITYDVLLRLASASDVYDATSGDFETEYIENKFRYTKKLFAGYQNEAVYIIKYNNNLQFEEVK